ncbi:hypothetical protein [Thauera aromatica]|uniref:hypothetical protein n=1 Tax=Thauera aromatica TaxID=59405 RepID=UPI001FFCE6C5|nr:hypothetical protein [Thauera aromatica]MCK2095216.1 hypothetical protein [Thauera aromatica]
MTTTSLQITAAWQRIALGADDVALITSDAVAPIQYATSTDADPPTGSGHTCTAGDRLTRAQFGAGAIWARIAPGSAFDTATVVLSTGTQAAAAAALAANGTPLPLASLPQSIAYNPDGTVNYIQVTHAGTTYRQTLTYTSGRITAVSAWEAQP